MERLEPFVLNLMEHGESPKKLNLVQQYVKFLVCTLSDGQLFYHAEQWHEYPIFNFE